MIKIIFSDMDGTLLDDAGQLPAEFDETIAELTKRGVLFAPSSGRQYFALIRQMEKYKDDFLFLAENGSFSVYRDEEICSSPMRWTDISKILRRADEIGHIYPVLCGKKNAYVREEWRPFIGEAEKYFTRAEFVDDFAAIDDEFIKVALCDCERLDAAVNIFPAMNEFSDTLQVCISGDRWVDILNLGVNKGWAIKHVQEKFGFRPEECAAFGDYMNDYEMLQSVYYSFAMENAYPEVKNAARFQAKSNTEHGVILQIKELIRQGLI